MSGRVSDRSSLLRSLIELERPLELVQRELADLSWDSDEELVTLHPGHVVHILEAFRDGVLEGGEVERWAEAIEGREDIGFTPSCRELLKEVVFDLANPALQGALTVETAQRWIDRLAQARGPSVPDDGGAQP